MERGHLLATLIGMAGKNPYPYGTCLGSTSEMLESAREAVYKGCPGRAAPDSAGVVELADARDSKSRVREDVRVQVPPPAPGESQGSGKSPDPLSFEPGAHGGT